jgi:hypothetical protein
MLRKTGVAALLLSAALFALAACLEPIRNVESHPLPQAAQNLSLEEISRNIILAGEDSRWRITPAEPGHLSGEFDDGGHEAKIDIAYSQTAYSITLVSSTNFHQEGDAINRHYNKWVRLLQGHIERRLVRAGAQPQ